MRDQPTISVIVPVYKVEPYLRKCLDSLVKQTYRNLQIILVDDGSPDLCGDICDEYAQADPRVCVIHKENGGQASARNRALEIAQGEWIGFVDSDDWVDPDFYAYLLEAAVRNDADVSVCGRWDEFESHRAFYAYKEEINYSTELALKELLKDALMRSYVWDKLWRKDLFDGVRFPEVSTFEDSRIVYKLFERAQKICCLPSAKYHYVQRKGSSVKNPSLANRFNFVHACEARYMDLLQSYPQLEDLLITQYVDSFVPLWHSVMKNTKQERVKYLPKLKEVAVFAKEHRKTALKNTHFGSAGKLVIYLAAYPQTWAFALAYLCNKIYSRKTGQDL